MAEFIGETTGNLRNALLQFDRKERHFLIQNCLSDVSQKLNSKFLARVSDALALASPLQPGAWWTTDYHFDWLAGALTIYYSPCRLATYRTVSFENCHSALPGKHLVAGSQHLVAGNQEDVDLLIADETRLLLIEAKRFGRWEKAQVNRKIGRLTMLRQHSEKLARRHDRQPIDIHILFASPGKGDPSVTQKVPNSLTKSRKGSALWKAKQPRRGCHYFRSRVTSVHMLC
jgi:hypothetical protein